MQISPQLVYDNLILLEDVDTVTSASYRQMAQDVLADSGISLNWRQMIADRLFGANTLLGRQTVEKNDSY